MRGVPPWCGCSKNGPVDAPRASTASPQEVKALLHTRKFAHIEASAKFLQSGKSLTNLAIAQTAKKNATSGMRNRLTKLGEQDRQGEPHRPSSHYYHRNLVASCYPIAGGNRERPPACTAQHSQSSQADLHRENSNSITINQIGFIQSPLPAPQPGPEFEYDQ